MKFFIDIVNFGEICEVYDFGIFDGVIINFLFMVKEGIIGQNNILKYYVDICNIVDGLVSVEVIVIDFEGMVCEGEVLVELYCNIVVKVLMIFEGIKVIKYFFVKGICINCILIFFLGQVLFVVKVGVIYVFLFVGCFDDIFINGMELIV